MSTAEIIFEQGLPSSVDAEKSILGAILLDASFIVEARTHITVEDFSLDSHRRIFRGMCALDEAESVVDIVTLGQYLDDSREIESVGGYAYLAYLTEGLPRRISITEYLKIVKEKSQLRQLISVCSSAMTLAADQMEKSVSIIGSIQDGLESVLGGETDNPLVSSYSVEALDQFNRETRLTESPGLSYGIPSLDELSGGMRRGEVTVVGARSGVGKTSLLCQATVVNCEKGIPSVLYSLEMTRFQILRRIWSIVSGVSYKRCVDPWLCNVDEKARVNDAAQTVAEWPLRIYDASDMPLSKIIASARLCMHRHGTRFIGVDYAQEIDSPGRDERTKVMMTARKLARLVKHEDASLMLLSQLTKTSRENYDKAPLVGDLIESGKLENVAHLVILLHRSFEKDENGNPTFLSDQAQIIVPKQRRGNTGVLQATFNKKHAIYEAV